MANPNPSKAHQFKKGTSGNLQGRPKGLFTTDMLKAVIAKHFEMSKEEIAALLKNDKAKAIDLIVCSAIMKAIKDGDIGKAEYLFMRSLGKVMEKLEVAHPEPVIIQRANGDQVMLDVKDVEALN
jgi:hypothetical protein